MLGVPASAAGFLRGQPTNAAASASLPLDADALRRRLQDVRTANSFTHSDHVEATSPGAASPLAPPLPPFIPVVVPPPCIIQCPRHFAFAHLRDAVHNPSGIIRQALQTVGGNPAFAIGGSWRGEACLTLSSHLERERVLSRGLLHFDGNVLSIEPVEEAERSIAIFDELVELEAIGMPHELWHDAGVKFVLSRLGDVCSVDQYCMQGDYTSVRALVMIAGGLPMPDSGRAPAHLPRSQARFSQSHATLLRGWLGWSGLRLPAGAPILANLSARCRWRRCQRLLHQPSANVDPDANARVPIFAPTPTRPAATSALSPKRTLSSATFATSEGDAAATASLNSSLSGVLSDVPVSFG
ncbi:hypothetical protein ZWY2020_051975 [Hordeum vulgare]|nr:hypothetical protein ZWY2020_051975 [Hordeum vulgare]